MFLYSNKEKVGYECGSSCTNAFSWGIETLSSSHYYVTFPHENPFVQEPSLQQIRKKNLVGMIYYDWLTIIKVAILSKHILVVEIYFDRNGTMSFVIFVLFSFDIKINYFFLLQKHLKILFFLPFEQMKKIYYMSHIASCTIITIWPKFIYIKVMSICHFIDSYWPLHVTGIPWNQMLFPLAQIPNTLLKP